MKKQAFLNKLKREKKLELVEPSEEMKDSYLEKSESNLISAKILFENKRLEEAIYLAYYSTYNSIVALFFKTGIKCENHSGSIILIKEIFGIDNKEISLAKKERIDKQYYTDFSIKSDDVVEAIEKAESFNKELYNFISKLNNHEIKQYRERLKNLLNM